MSKTYCRVKESQNVTLLLPASGINRVIEGGVIVLYCFLISPGVMCHFSVVCVATLYAYTPVRVKGAQK
jgi:hypothetical protein